MCVRVCVCVHVCVRVQVGSSCTLNLFSCEYVNEGLYLAIHGAALVSYIPQCKPIQKFCVAHHPMLNAIMNSCRPSGHALLTFVQY